MSSPSATTNHLHSARFENRVALVTGGTSGIGRATALAYGREGAQVVVAGRRVPEGEAVVRSITDAGGAAIFVRADVTRELDVVNLVARTLERFGRLDVAFNNAGLLGPRAPLVEQTPEDYERIFDANVKSVYFSLRHEIPAMLRVGGGAIVNNASIGGSLGFPNVGLYVGAKHAVVGLTRTAALDYARQNIRVNAVSPAGIQTDMLDTAFGAGVTDRKQAFAEAHPVGRLGSPEEIADAVLYLTAPGASFVTGHDLLVDGGYAAQ
ncbi:MAG TPA: SDR family oxidoreductase [Opitutus sp.]|nr:SDR family oxidoreductase [Opitutus sp.]